MAPLLQAIGCNANHVICISSLILICLITLIVIPFSIHFTYKFYRMRRDQAIVRRYPSTLIVSSILSIIYIFIIIQYLVIDYGISHRFRIWVEPIITRPYLMLIILINILRIWLIIYDINENAIQSRYTWQSLLSSTANDKEWFSQNRLTWGNWKYLTKICAVLWLILSVLCALPLFVTSSSFSAHLTLVFPIAFNALLLSFCFGICYALPSFADAFFIVKEIKIVIVSCMVCLVSWCSLIYWSEHGNIFAFLQIFIIFLFVFTQIFVSEFLVIHMLETTAANKTSHNKVKIIGHTLFRAIMASDLGIEEYMKHLQHECTTENGLFFLELMQWMYAATDQEWDRFDISPFTPERITYIFAKIIPISSINIKDQDWFDKIDGIYTKYVSTSAEYQVNLPYSIVQEYMQLLRLYKMKKEIESGTYVAKFVKKIQQKAPTIQRKTSTSFWSVSKAFSIRNRKPKKLDALALGKPDVMQATRSADAASQMSTPNMDDMQQQVTPRIPSIIHEQHSHKPNLDNPYAMATQQGTLRSKTRKVKFIDEASPRPRAGSDTGFTIKSLDTGRSDIYSLDTARSDQPPLRMQCTNELETIFTDVVQTSVESDLTTPIKFNEDSKDDDPESPLVKGNTDRKLEQFLDVILKTLSLEQEEEECDEMKDGMNTMRSDTANTPKPKPCSIDVLDINMTTLSGNQSLRTPGSDGARYTPTLTMDYDVKKNLSFAAGQSPLPSIPAIGKRFTRAISVAFTGRGFTERSMKKPIADFVEDNEAQTQYVIDPQEAKQMEMAKTINLGHFIAISCFALNEVVLLNLQSVGRFRRSKYFKIFNDNVNLEQLLNNAKKQISPKSTEPE